MTVFLDPWLGASRSERALSTAVLGHTTAAAGAWRSSGAQRGLGAEEWERGHDDERGGKSFFASSVR
jgi:hypothetical protein